MNEKNLIPVWFDRFEILNRGVLRLLAVISLIGAAIFVLLGLFITGIGVIGLFVDDHFGDLNEMYDFIALGVGSMVIGVIALCLFWVLIRFVLWIYDGFVGTEV